MIGWAVAMTIAGSVGALPWSHRHAPVAAVEHADELQVAKRRRKRRWRGSVSQAITIETHLPAVELKVRRKWSKAVAVAPGQKVGVRLEEKGRAVVVVYQALELGQSRARDHVVAHVVKDGEQVTTISYRGRRDRRARVLGSASISVTRSQSAALEISAAPALLEVQVPEASTSAVVEFQWYAGDARRPAPVTIVAASPSEPTSPPQGTPPPPLEPPELPEQSTREVAQTALPPSDATLAADGTGEVVAAGTSVEARIRRGEISDGETGEYPRIIIYDGKANTSDIFARASAENPFKFLAQGPGEVTLRVHCLAPSGEPLSGTSSLTILENDVLLQSFDLDVKKVDYLRVEGDESLDVSKAIEYKLTLGPKVSAFTLQPSETATHGLAIRYEFALHEQDPAMALTLDLGNDLGLAKVTTITEVAVREKVVQKVVQKVVRVSAERREILGVAVTAGALLPTWGGNAAPAAGLELQWILPFFDQSWAICAEGQAQWHTLLSRTTDAAQAELRSRSIVWVIPARFGPTFRYGLGESVRLGAGARGVINTILATSKTRGGERNDSATVFGAAGIVSFEVRVGAGWWAMDAGYVWSQAKDIGDVVRGFSPSGLEVGTRFRFVL